MTLPVTQETHAPAPNLLSGLSNFADARKLSVDLAASDIVPKTYQSKPANCLIAIEMAQRTGAGIMAVMQSLYIVHGNPSWSSQFIIAALNACGRFSPLRFDVTGEGDTLRCVAWAIEKATGEKLEGPPITMEMAQAEGWVNKSSSKWKTMPQMMIRYRAASFFGRLYAPDVLMGMYTDDEARELGPRQIEVSTAEDLTTEILNESLPEKKPEPEPTPRQQQKAALQARRDKLQADINGWNLDQTLIEEKCNEFVSKMKNSQLDKAEALVAEMIEQAEQAIATKQDAAHQQTHTDNKITCPNSGAVVRTNIECAKCENREGCPEVN